VIEDDCIPGGSFAVARVVPESETRLNDFGAWTAQGPVLVVVEGGALVLRAPDSLTSYGVSLDLRLVPGRRDALRASVQHDAQA
jgi:hypothetical protein